MKNYIAKIVYQIIANGIGTQQQFDEQLCLIHARDEQEAFFKARALGVKNDEMPEEGNTGKVSWKFIDVPYLKEIQQLKDGDELYSCISEKDAEDNYAAFVRKRAQDLQQKHQQALQTA